MQYFIKFVDTQTGEEDFQGYSIKRLQSLIREGEYATIGNLIYKPEHLKTIRDSKTEKIMPKSMYSRVFIDGLTAKDFMTVADCYFLTNDPARHPLPRTYRNGNSSLSACRKIISAGEKFHSICCTAKNRIEFYQKHLQRLITPNHQDAETKQLLKKYTLKDEKTLADKNLAFRRAAAQGRLDDLKKLLFLGAQINLQGSGSGKTALHHAVIGNHFNIVMFLLSIKANAATEDSNKKIALNYMKPGSSLYKEFKKTFETNPEIPMTFRLTPPST